jgi:hypothetical protein
MVGNPVIFLRLKPSDKDRLSIESDKRGMQNSTLVRMIVLDFLDKCAKEK